MCEFTIKKQMTKQKRIHMSLSDELLVTSHMFNQATNELFESLRL